MKQRTIKYKGLDLQLNIDVDSLVDSIRGKYKSEINRLRKLVNRRDEYIHEMHAKLKDRDAILYMMIDGVKIFRKVRRMYDLKDKELMILSYLSSVNMSKIRIINDYFESISAKFTNRSEMQALERKEYIFKIDKYGYYVITDKGRKVLNSIHIALKQDYTYFMHNRNAKKNRRIYVEGHSKYTPEEKTKRSEQYKKLMTPFWSKNIKMIPRDKERRIEIIREWMDSQEQVDPYYFDLIDKWSAKPALI